MGRSSKLTFTVSNGDSRTLNLYEGLIRIGRMDDNDLPFDNPYISRHHAEIFFDEGRYWIRDLGSTSGTFINDEPVDVRGLDNGDLIRLGRGRGVDLIFSIDESLDDSFSSTKDSSSGFEPVRVLAPEEARFINTSRLPQSGKLGLETVDRLRSLYEFTSELLTSNSFKDLSEKLAAFLHRTLRAERCAVLMRNKMRDTFDLTASYPANDRVHPSRSITNKVFTENVAILSFDARVDARFSAGHSVQLQSIRSVMCVPIGSKTRLWGVCYVDNLTASRVFCDEELDFLAAVGRQAGLAMENLYLMDEQRRSLESFIRTLAASLDARDDNTAGHSARVGALSAGIARTMDVSPRESRLTYYAGLLHDYGKIGIRDDVLLKPAGLTPEEYERVKEHPQHTFRLLSKIRFPEDLSEIPFVAAAHHERWDGTGYPHGLKGSDIPRGSRIVAVADTYDALTEERCYHSAWEPEQAYAELKRFSGVYFDPEVMEAFSNYFINEVEPRYRRRHAISTAEQKIVTGIPAD
ncbi:MAG TPA: HD domain-containing phosphohydrolase [Blastocatellia bacterium]|jgi:HD-GYP domain-containing protein (c-di-GMP phosphodiesterase class II)/pSer/pThr/pTyr-binding forkhead associated (FHA) protein|nr:HD domain-containing phosphohydrolase [Blastocatellia bacterium]